jgi:hypothetical protein
MVVSECAVSQCNLDEDPIIKRSEVAEKFVPDDALE